MTVQNTLAVNVAVMGNEKPQAVNMRFLVFPISIGYSHGLGCRDSNPNYLIQNQASYR